MATERTRRTRGTRQEMGANLKKEWEAALPVNCEYLKFGDLEVGEKFIVMPFPGDNAGHGGLLNGCHVFMKVYSCSNDLVGRRNCVKVLDLDIFGRDDYGAYVPEETPVIKVD